MWSVWNGPPRQRSGSRASHLEELNEEPAFRLARKGVPARSAAAVTQGAGAEQRTRASGLTAAADRARGKRAPSAARAFN